MGDTPLDTFVVRIYRRELRTEPARCGHDQVAVTGIVENAATGARTTFHDTEQLWAVLAAIPATSDPVPANGVAKLRKK